MAGVDSRSCIHNTSFSCSLHMGPLSWSVTLHQAKKGFPVTHYSLLGALVSYEENEMECCEYGPWSFIHNTSFSCNLRMGPTS
jgi:hypothetical protein